MKVSTVKPERSVKTQWHCVLHLFTAATSVGICIVLIITSVWVIREEQKEIPDLSVVAQIAEDWSQLPFVSIRVSETACRASEKPVFSRVWLGTLDGCLVGGDYVITK